MTEVEELSEAVAAAKRAYNVANSLEQEYRNKLRQAEEETRQADIRLSEVSYKLHDAVYAQYKDVHGDPLGDVDREAFEKRYEARIAEIIAIRKERDRQRISELDAAKTF